MKALPKYLVFFLGPCAAAEQWTAPLAKFSGRVDDIAKSGAAVSIATHTYNIKAVPTLAYVAQLIPLPPNAVDIERGSLFKLLEMA